MSCRCLEDRTTARLSAGVERLDNVIVIGASNRIDMIDPAVLRPGRLDVKIKVDRPGPEQARRIVARHTRSPCP